MIHVRIRHLCKVLLPLLPAAAALGLTAAARYAPGAVEAVHVRGVFRALSAVIGTLTQYIPVSLTEALAVAAVPLLLGAAVVLICRRRRIRWRRLLRGVCWALSLLLLCYTLMHGLNYSRRPLAELMALPAGQADTEELAALCRWCAENASAARAECAEDGSGCMTLDVPLSKTLAAGGAGYDRLAADYPFLFGTVHRAKGVRLSHWWSYTGITGMYFPFFAEANVNVDIADSELPMTVAHELAHTRGFAHEDECNFLGILACTAHPDAGWRYSGWLSAYIYVSNALYEVSPAEWTAVRDTCCSAAVQRDLAQRSVYWAAFSGPAMTFSSEVNDTFIRANGDAEGIVRYDGVTALLLMWKRTL